MNLRDVRTAAPAAFLPHGDVAVLEKAYGFTAEAIADRMAKEWGR